MSEDEYKSLEALQGLPLYDESDPRCGSIDRVDYDPAYTGEVVEASEFAHAQRCVARDDLTPKGAIRFDMGPAKRIFAYFWVRRG
jgi:hypothetical protein